ALGVEEKGAALRAEISAQMKQLAETMSGIGEKKRVLFILSMQDGRIMASGTGTAANGIIELAGAENAIVDFEGYKQVTDEAIITIDPDAILMMDRVGDHGTDPDTLFAHPAIATTQAAKDKALVRMDGLYLLGFGPRTASAALDLAKALYGDDFH
ncbi:MAG: ABC transporter substrate-binding protein, partial [Oricola sp.]|nr:ABC transporter substrate-binding protein [Oricola sp.]